MLSVSSVTSAPHLHAFQAQNVHARPLRSEPSTPINVPASSEQQNGEIPLPVGDNVSLSPEARQRFQKENSDQGSASDQSEGPLELTQEEQRAIEQLKQRDREVRAHEQAHLASAGQYAAGGPSFTYQQGPDGKRYAIGGEVPIDVGKERTPQETINKMQIVRQAALAPASPSGADRNIAATASLREAQARMELQAEQAEAREPAKESSDPASEPDSSTASPDSSVDQSIQSRFSQQISTVA